MARSRHRNWVFTINNPTDIDAADPIALPEGARYIVYQLERGEERNTPHYQGYIEYYNPVSLSRVVRGLGDGGAHVEPRRGTQADARNYAMKEDTRCEGPWEHGDFVPDSQGHRTDLEEVAKELKRGDSLLDILENHPAAFLRYSRGIMQAHGLYEDARDFRDKPVPTVIWIWGPTGVGKTRYATNWLGADYFSPRFALTRFYDGYNGEQGILWDDVAIKVFERWNSEPYKRILRILDRYRSSVDRKGRHPKYIRSHRFAITSSWNPNTTIDDQLKRRITHIINWQEDQSWRGDVDYIKSILPLVPDDRARKLWEWERKPEESSSSRKRRISDDNTDVEEDVIDLTAE